MSIPSTEFKPDRFRTQPQSQIRTFLAEASEQETLGFLEVLRQRVAIKPLSFVLQTALSLLLLVLGLAYNIPLLFILAILLIPAYNALLSLSLSPGIQSFPAMLGSIGAILIMAVALFGGGFLAHELFSQTVSADALPYVWLLNNTWVEWLILLGAAILSAVWFTTNTSLARLSTIVFNVLAFVPFAMAGWQFGRMGIQNALPTLALAFLRLSAVVVVMVITLWILRVKPRASTGWIIFSLLLVLLGVALFLNFSGKISEPLMESKIYQEVEVTPIQSIETSEDASLTPSPTATN